MIWTATLSSKGQLVLPRPVREKLKVQAGSKIVFTEQGDRFELRAYGGDLLSWYGAISTDSPQDWEAVQEQVGEARAHEVVGEAQSD